MSVSMRGSERVVSNRGSKKSLKGRLVLAAAVSLTASGMWSACADAARGGNDVKGAQVIAGAAQIANKGNTTTIRAIDKTIIKYDRFNIPRNGTVKFIQPSSSSTVLNRIDGAMPSRIEGHFTANGIVFFVNPAGVMFGPTAVVDVGRLYAGAGTIGDQDFLGGVNKFSTSNGAVVNQGKISGEQVHLFGAQVINRGSIVADGGIVTMSSGKDVFIGEEGGNIMVKVEGPTGKAAGVVNSGTVSANKGVVRMSGAGDIYSIAVNTSGMVKANDVAIDAGKGVALVSGKIDASNPSAGGVGGKVTITGDKVGLVGATVDASGAAGGGTVLVGGDVHGGGSTPTATATLVSPGSTIKADAIDSGSGGKVVVWSDKLTAFGGKISAKGGVNGGDGGFVEVSGKERLIYKGTVDVTAPHGAAGTLLLDPKSIAIGASGTQDIHGDTTGADITSLADLNDALADEVGVVSKISNTAVNGLLTGGNTLVLSATDDIFVNAAVTGGGNASLTLNAPNVTLNSTITLAGTGVLSGTASNVIVNAGGTIQNGLNVSGAGGTVTVNHATLTLSSPLTASGGRNLNLQIPTVTLNSTITMSGGGTLSGNANSVTVNSGGSIQNGVDIAGNNKTVTVGSGTFVEDIVVNKSLTLMGNNGSAVANVPDGNAGFGSRDPETVIHGQVHLNAPNTTFDGFKVENVATGAGIVASNAQGDLIANNIITDNVFGLSLASDGSTAVTVQGNLFDRNNRAGGAHGNGIYTDFKVSKVVIDNNHFVGNTEGSISFFGSATNPQSDVTISRNTIADFDLDSTPHSGNETAGGPISLETITNVKILGNTIVNTSSDAIWIAGGVGAAGAGNAITISNNFIQGNAGAAVKFVFNIDAAPARNVILTENAISENADGAIVLNAERYTGPLEATSNYWGSGNGPKDQTSPSGNSFNIDAQGDKIINPDGIVVNYVRWLTNPADQNGAAGFQADTGSLFAPITVNGSFFSNIQAAHNFAAPAGTLALAGGEYTEAVTTSKKIKLQFTGDGTLKGSLALGGKLTVLGDGHIIIDSTVNAGSNDFVVDTQTGTGTFININGKISASGGSVSILGQQNVTIGATGGIDPPASVLLSSLGDVLVNSAVAAQDTITISAGEGGTGDFKLNAPSGSLTVTTTTPTPGSISIVTGTTGGNVMLGGSVSAPGAVTITTKGTVTQPAGTITAGTLGIAGTGTVTLDQANSVGTIGVSTSNSDVLFKNSGTFDVGVTSVSGISAGTGTVRLVSGGGITQTNPSAAIIADTLGVNASGAVTLLGANTTAKFAVSNNNEVSYASTGGVLLASVPASGSFALTNGVTVGSHDVLLKAGGEIRINQPLLAGTGTVRLMGVGGASQTAGITAGTLAVRASDGITLTGSNTAANFAAASDSGDSIEYSSSGNITLVSVTASGPFLATSGIGTSNGDVLLDAGGALAINQTISAGTGTVRLVSGAGITQTATITADALGVNAVGNVDLRSVANPTAKFAGSGSNDISYKSNGALTLVSLPASGSFALTTGVSTSGNVMLLSAGNLHVNQALSAGTIRLVSSAGAVDQTAKITGTTLGARASTGIDLSLATNDVTTVTSHTSTGNINYRDASGVIVGSLAASGTDFAATSGVVADAGTVTITSGALTVNTDVSGTAITLSGSGVTQGSGSTMDAGSGLISINANGAAVDLQGTVKTNSISATAVQIQNPLTTKLGNTLATSGGLSITGATGAVSQNGSTTIQVSRVAVNTTSTVDLGNDNSIGTVLGITSSGGLTIKDIAGGLTVSGTLTNGAGDAISITTAGGPLAIQTDVKGGAVVLGGGGIMQTLGSDITATTLRLNSTGDVVLTNLGNSVGMLAASVSGDLSFTNNAGLTIGTASGLNGINIGSGTLTLTAAGDILQTLPNEPITSGAATFHTTGASGSIIVEDTANAISGTVRFITDGTGNVGLINTLATDIGASSVNGQMAIFSSGPITDSAAINVANTAQFGTLNNSGAAITLDDLGSTFLQLTVASRDAANAVIKNGPITVTTSGEMKLSAAESNGAITLTADKISLVGAANSVQGTGALVMHPLSASADIDLGTNQALGFSFTQAELLALKTGFNSITIGRSNGTGIVTVSAPVTFQDSITVIGGSFTGAATLSSAGAANMTLHATTGTVGSAGTPLNVSVGGALTVNTDGADSDGNIFIKTSGALALGANITTDGTTTQSVNIEANGITIAADNSGTSNDDLVLNSTAGFVNSANLNGNSISITASNDITDAGSALISTSGAGGLTLITPANIGVDVGNPLNVSVGGAGLLTLGSAGTPVGGNVFISSPAVLSVGDVNTAAGTKTIDIRTTSGNLRLASDVNGDDDWVLNSAGNINNTTKRLTANSVDADAVTGIGTLGSFNIATPIVSADSSTSGFVNIDNSSASPVTINSLSTSGGSNVTYSQSGGGSATFNAAHTAANGNITLVDIGGDVITAGPITAGGTGQAQVVSTTGSITGSGTISGGTVDLQAVSGIGTVGVHVPVVADSLKASTSGASASIFIDNSSGTMTLTDVHTLGATSDITISQSGLGNDLVVKKVSATDGNVTLSTAGTINESPADTTVKITANNANLIADNGIGTTSALDLSVSGKVKLNTLAGGANISDAVGFSLDTSTVGGDLTAAAQSGGLGTIGILTTTTTGGAITLTAVGGITLGADVNSDAGSISFNGPVSLAAPVIVDTTKAGTVAGADISFSDNVNEAQPLTLKAGAGNISVTGAIGGIHPLASVDATGHNITLHNVASTGHQIYTGSGTITLNGNYAADTGAIKFDGNATLATAVNVNAKGGTDADDVTFTQTIQGPGSLTATAATAGDVSLGDGSLGAALLFVAVNANDISLNGMASTGAQGYTGTGTITLGGVYSNSTGAITFTAPTSTLSANVTVTTLGATDTDDISFSGAITGAHVLTLTAATAGDVSIGGNVNIASIGATANDIAVKNVTTSAGQTYTANGIITLGGATYTSAGGNIDFAGDTVLAVDNTVVTTSGGSSITFEETLKGAHALTLNTDGDTVFKGTVGVGAPLTSLTTDLGGTTRINGGAITTGAGQTYKDQVKLGAVTTLTGAGITFSETLDSDNVSTPRALTIIDTLDTTFTKAVGATAPLGSLTTDSASSNSGKTIVKSSVATAASSGAITTTGIQQFNDPVQVAATTTSFTATGATTSVNFANTLDADAAGRDVTVTAGGSITFGGAVGAIAATSKLNSLTASAGSTSTISINGTAVNTVQDQIYNSKVSIGNSVGATLSGRDIRFMSLLDGAHPVTVTGSGVTRFVGAVGSGNPLTSLTSNGTGTTSIEGGSVRTSGAQSFTNPVTIKDNTTLTGVGISFGETLESDVTSGTSDGRTLTIDSGVTRSLGVVTAATGDITIGGAVGLGSRIASVTFTGRNINIDSVKTTKDQTYTAKGIATLHNDYTAANGAFLMTGNTKVGGDTTVITNGTAGGESANDITFHGTIDGNHSLTLHASGTADVTVDKAIGGGTALGVLDIDAQTINLVSVIAKSGSGNSGDITLKVAPNAPQDNRFDSDSTGHSAKAFKPVGTITLAGGVQSTGGNVVLGARTDRSDTDIVAFPTILIKPPAGGTAVISGKNVTMGKNEKLVVNGSVKIQADQTATLSDITAADSIEVSATTITIRTRNPGTVISSDGATLLNDVNTDFVAKNSINFHGSVSLDGTADDAHRVQFATVGGDVTGAPGGTSVKALLEKDFSIQLAKGSEFIDLRAEGASVTNPAAALAGAAPQESRQPEVENSVASSQATELQRLGIFAKKLDRNSFVGFLEGFMLYNDVPNAVASGEIVPREQYQVTRNRLSYDGARRVLGLYYIAFDKTDDNGRVILDKNGDRIDNTDNVRKAIEQAVVDYRAKTGQKTGSIDPEAFRQYVETTPSQTERDALKYMNRLRNLFNEILGEPGSRKGMGLTPFEAGISRTVLMDGLGVDGIEPEKLQEAILFDTSRLGRPQARPMVSPMPKPAAK